MNIKRLAKILNDINNILLPLVCFGCNAQLSRGESVLCAVCRHELPLTDYTFADENPVDRIFYGRIPIKKAGAFVFFAKNGIVKNLLHQLKYKKQEHIGAFFGDWLGALLGHEPLLQTVDVVVPVPLHPKKQKKRGYNQVALFSQKIATSIGAEYRDDILLKVINTKTQTKKDRQLRWENAKNVFQLNPTVKKNFKHLLLIDDVITTGATIEACAKTLHQVKGIDISVLSIAVVPGG
ncbi:ComF family protein [Flagellimonas hymeniacidonis]|uniref:ComF family protein n=1 Tax=Flagellimonas hymeniacidonis TaxID=2603628 RepID=A0A5C8V7R7_9FLAO|nr:ComF family protein [Flagellimonas hymeniacidonis]TXN37965.1 ComF family protein [Flagellimonas hymeniacidonis]